MNVIANIKRYLALVCLMKKESYEKIGLIKYNFQCFKTALQKVFEVRKIINQKKEKRKQKEKEKQQTQNK